MPTTLFVAGFGSRTRARDLAYEFERYGRLVRCDIPAPKNHSSKPYAFVEFEDARDAETSFNEMHGRRIDGYTISVQWAKNSPSSTWRLERSPRRYRSPSPRHPSYGRSRSRSPYHDRSPPPPPPPPPYPSHGHDSGSGGYHTSPFPYHRHRDGPPSPRRGRSPPPHRYRYSRSPPPPHPPHGRHYDDYPYPPTSSSSSGRPVSVERRSTRSISPPPTTTTTTQQTGHYLHRSPLSRSPSPQRNTISPRRSRSPDYN